MSHTISTWVAESLVFFLKEWRSELRTRYALNTVGLFALTTLIVVSLSIGPMGTDEEARPVLPVLLWLIVLFAASAGLPRTFVHEEETHTATALRLAATPSCLFCGKALYNCTLLLLLEVAVTPLFVILLHMPVRSAVELSLILFAGGYGLAIGSTLIAAMIAQGRARGPLFAVVAFPVLLPVLRLAILATQGVVLDQSAGNALQQIFWYDGILTVAGFMLFPAIWNP